MMPLCSAFTAADKTNALAAGNIAEMSLEQCLGTKVALCCCCMNMPSAGRAKLADCNAHEDKTVISKQLSKLCVPKLRRAAQGAAHEKELLEPNADAAHDENELPKTRRSCGEKELRRELSTQSVLGE